MDFLRMLLDRARTTQEDEDSKYMEYILRQDLMKYGKEGDGITAINAGSTSIPPESGRQDEYLGEESLTGIAGVENDNALKIYHRGDSSPTPSRAYTAGVPSTGLVTQNARTSTVPSTEALHFAAPMKAPEVKPDAGGSSHVVRVPIASAITICIVVEVLVFVFMLVFVIFQARRVMKRREDQQGLIDGDVEKANRSEEFSSGVSCSTSTPNSRRGPVYPGLCSAISENLHCMLSPIDSPGQTKRYTFSCSPCPSIDVKPYQIQGCLSEDKQCSSNWLDFSPESKRALYAMTRSRSTPEHLAAARSTMSSCSGGTIETNIGRIDTGIYKREELAAKFVGKWKQIKSKKESSKLTFKVTYDSEIELLTVFIDSALNLPDRVKDGYGDIFVKLALDPDHKRRSLNSSIRHGTRNPEFKQNFAFRIASGAVSEMCIKFTVCEYDQYSHPIAIGRVDYALSEHDFNQGADAVVIQRELEKPDKEGEEATMGDLMISLTYLPNAERVNLIIMKARNVRLPEWGDQEVGRSILDTFVKITIMRCGKVMKHKNTKVVRRSCSPVFNEAFSIDRMRLSEMPECCFVLSVCVRLNHFRSHRSLGRCVVGGKDCAVGDGLAHWNEMSDSPRSIVARWHKIQP
nr:synaptotagmin-6-like isoform X1 [Lytechinus pictus]